MKTKIITKKIIFYEFFLHWSCGTHVGPTWFPSVSHMGPTWFSMGSRSNFSHGSHMVPTWFPQGPTRIPHGTHMIPTCVPCGSHVGFLSRESIHNLCITHTNPYLRIMYKLCIIFVFYVLHEIIRTCWKVSVLYKKGLTHTNISWAQKNYSNKIILFFFFFSFSVNNSLIMSIS